MNLDDLLELAPMENYNAPDLPTYIDKRPDLSKKTPRRWKNKAVIAATIGLLGTTVLTGCAFFESTIPEHPIYCRSIHHGGAGGGPIYVAHLTEQEALEIIRDQLEEVGLNLNEVQPPLSVMVEGIYEEGFDGEEAHRLLRDDIEMHLLDEENGIGIVTHRWGWELDEICTIETDERITQRFLDEHDVSVGVFFRGSIHIGWDDGGETEVEEEEVDQARIRLENELTDQVQSFIEQLREEDIID